MKIGIRKPSLAKSFSARTTGKAKRKLKRLTNPLYGKKGMGYLKNPGKALKGKLYRKTTLSTKKAFKGLGGCLSLCFISPFLLCWYTLVLLWYLIKYLFLGIVWLFTFVINGCISIAEWFINLNRSRSTTLIEEQDTTFETTRVSNE